MCPTLWRLSLLHTNTFLSVSRYVFVYLCPCLPLSHLGCKVCCVCLASGQVPVSLVDVEKKIRFLGGGDQGSDVANKALMIFLI